MRRPDKKLGLIFRLKYLWLGIFLTLLFVLFYSLRLHFSKTAEITEIELRTLRVTKTEEICSKVLKPGGYPCYKVTLGADSFTIDHYWRTPDSNGASYKTTAYNLNRDLKGYIVQDFKTLFLDVPTAGLRKDGVYLFVLAWRNYDYGYDWSWLPKLRGKNYSQHLLIFKLEFLYPRPVWVSSTLFRVVRSWQLKQGSEGLILETKECPYSKLKCSPTPHKYRWDGWKFVPYFK